MTYSASFLPRVCVGFFTALVLLPVLAVAGEPATEDEEGSGKVPEVIKAEVAGGYVDQVKTVEGTVKSATYIPRIKGRPTFIDLQKPHPHSVFTVVIWGRNRPKFGENPENVLRDKTIRVTGKIGLHKEKPQIIVTKPEQIQILGEDGFSVMRPKPAGPQPEE